MLTFGTTSRSLSKASLRPFIRFLSLALAMLRLCFMMVGVGGCRFFFRPPFPFFFVPIEELYASPWDSWEKNIFLQTSHNNNYRKLKYQHYTTSTLYMIISWFFSAAFLYMFFFVQVNGVCICFYVTDVKCVSDCHVTLQSRLQRMRCLRHDGDLRSVDGYIRKIWGRETILEH